MCRRCLPENVKTIRWKGRKQIDLWRDSVKDNPAFTSIIRFKKRSAHADFSEGFFARINLNNLIVIPFFGYPNPPFG